MAEILAPCGSEESLTAALRCGCDAVYLGGEHFSARQNAVNFTKEQLKKAVYRCHKRGVKVYQAVNTVVFDEQLEECKAAVKYAAEIGIDGLITQDLALVEICRNCCPDMEYHASTQMTVHSESGVLQAKALGFSRAVLSRELPRSVIEELTGLGIETEVFVHGALCMSVSGQCYMSAVIGSRSANRGLCAQACRLPASAEKGEERYDLSLKDMSYLNRLGDLSDMGVTSLKIEGRMKRPEYVAAAVDSCKNALEGKDFDLKRLEAVFSRSGFTDGYFTGKTGKAMFGTRQKEDVISAAKILPELHELYRRTDKRGKVAFEFSLHEGKPCVLSAEDENGVRVQVTGDVPEKALKKPCDEDFVKKQLSKLGDTIYEFGGLKTDIDGGLAFPVSAINEMRRRVIALLDNERSEYFTRRVSFDDRDVTDFKPIERTENFEIRVIISKLSQLEGLDLSDVGLLGVPAQLVLKAIEMGVDKDKILAVTPRFTFDEKSLVTKLERIKTAGVTKMLAMNIGHCLIAERLGFELHTGYSFNLCNSAALNCVKKLGAKDCTVSFEMKAAQVQRLKKPLPAGIFAYGRLPLMLTANCPIKQDTGCKGCRGHLFDRTGREFPVKCPKEHGCAEILNSDILYLADKLDDFKNADFLELHFYEETSEEIGEIIRAYKYGSAEEKPHNATNGLYYRGVL